MRLHSIVMTMVLCGASLVMKAQVMLMPVTGAPVTVMWTVTTESKGKIETETIEGARAVDGSIYLARIKDGQAYKIDIQDVAHQQSIEISPNCNTYSQRAPMTGPFKTISLAQEHSWVAKYWAGRQYNNSQGNFVRTSLGEKSIDGMMIFGDHFAHTKDGQSVGEGDSWMSDLGFTYSSADEMVKDQKVVRVTLAEWKRGEPDASLFVVPKGYFYQSFPNASPEPNLPMVEASVTPVCTVPGRRR